MLVWMLSLALAAESMTVRKAIEGTRPANPDCAISLRWLRSYGPLAEARLARARGRRQANATRLLSYLRGEPGAAHPCGEPPEPGQSEASHEPTVFIDASHEQMQGTAWNALPALHSCYETALKTDPRLGGVMRILAHVRDPYVTPTLTTGLDDSALQACVHEDMKEWLPPVGWAADEVSFTITFEAAPLRGD